LVRYPIAVEDVGDLIADPVQALQQI